MRVMIQVVALLLGGLVPAVSSAQTAPAQAPAQTAPAAPVASEPLKTRLGELPGIVMGKGDYDAYFAPAFRAQVSKARLEQVTAPLIAAAGPVTTVEKITPTGPWAAEFTLGFSNGVATGRIAVDPNAPHQVTGLLFTGLTGRETTLGQALDGLKALPGSAGYAIARLGDSGPEWLAEHNAGRPYAIGSAFKLVILAELVRATHAGERQWTDIVTLDGKMQLPGGAYFTSQAGTQVTLRDLAAKMISVSDNSATDILIHVLGRERIEAMLPVVGIADLAGMRPFITTLEAFKLKGIRHGELGRRWIAADEAGRRAMLPVLAAEPVLAIDPTLFADGKPVMIDGIEWFATPADLVRLMDWLRRNTESGPGSEARAILAINPGLSPTTTGHWGYTGFKGGSEPGVINTTFLLRAKDGSWYAVASSWNDTQQAVDTIRFVGLISRVLEFSAPR